MSRSELAGEQGRDRWLLHLVREFLHKVGPVATRKERQGLVPKGRKEGRKEEQGMNGLDSGNQYGIGIVKL